MWRNPPEGLKLLIFRPVIRSGSRFRKRWKSKDTNPIGRKIGFYQSRYLEGVQPEHTHMGPPYTSRQWSMRGGTVPSLPLEGMTAPRIEPEVVFGLGTSVVGDEYAGRLDKLFECIEWVALGFEIVDCHYLNWEFTAADVVADFGAHAMLVIGEKKRALRQRLPSHGRAAPRLSSRIKKRTGRLWLWAGARTPLGSPLAALQYLVELLDRQKWAEPLGTGEVVTTGTLTPLPYIHPGEKMDRGTGWYRS